jgi:hypothetical protein
MTFATACVLWLALSCVATPCIGAFLYRQSRQDEIQLGVTVADLIYNLPEQPNFDNRVRVRARTSPGTWRLGSQVARSSFLPGNAKGPALQ